MNINLNIFQRCSQSIAKTTINQINILTQIISFVEEIIPNETTTINAEFIQNKGQEANKYEYDNTSGSERINSDKNNGSDQSNNSDDNDDNKQLLN